jgi:dTDP-4-dehydrorhamnose 3,5-epimerase
VDDGVTIEGVVIREIRTHRDERGWLSELFRHDEIDPELHPVMAYVSMTRPGAARGPHEHRDQADLFCFLGPSTFRIYLWDNRPTSRTYKAHAQLDAGAARPLLVIVPKGVVHAYKNVGSEDGLVFNSPNRLYAGWKRTEPVDEIRHENDPSSPFSVDAAAREGEG